MQVPVSDFGLYEIQKLLFHLFFDAISKWHTVERSVGNLHGNKGYRNLKTENVLQNESRNGVGSYELNLCGSS
jgi:hypothetical protein